MRWEVSLRLTCHPAREKGTSHGQKGKGKVPDIRISPESDYTYRPHLRTHDAKRNDFPVELTPPTSDVSAKMLVPRSWINFDVRCSVAWANRNYFPTCSRFGGPSPII